MVCCWMVHRKWRRDYDYRTSLKDRIFANELMVLSLAFLVSGDRIWCAPAPLWPQYIRNPLHHFHVYGLRLTVFNV